MAAQQRLAPSMPNPVYVNETSTNQKLAPVVYANENVTTVTVSHKLLSSTGAG